MAASAYLSDELITAYFVGTKYISEHTGPPGTAGANEVTAGVDANYARQPATMAKSLEGALTKATNSADVSFPAAAAGSSYSVTHLGVWDAASGGNFLAAIPLDGAALPVVAGTINTFGTDNIVVLGD